MLADSSREDQQLQAAENGDKTGDGLFGRSCKHFQGQTRAGIAASLMQLAHVAGDAGDAQQAGVAIEKVFQLRHVVSVSAKNI